MHRPYKYFYTIKQLKNMIQVKNIFHFLVYFISKNKLFLPYLMLMFHVYPSFIWVVDK